MRDDCMHNKKYIWAPLVTMPRDYHALGMTLNGCFYDEKCNRYVTFFSRYLLNTNFILNKIFI